MPLINLIREQRLAARQREQKAKTALLGTLGAGGLALIGAGALLLDTTRLNLEASNLEAKQKKLAPILKQLDDAEKEIDRLTPRIETLKKAKDATQKWNIVLNHLSGNTPKGSWLTGIKTTQTDKTKPVLVTFTGMASSHESASEFTLRLTYCNELQNPTLKSTTEKTAQGNTKVYEFEVTAELKGSGEEAKSKEAKSA
ncbi:MAG: PilN domain-containing protein [Fimbriimonadaceae bacterium]|nr:PilN domain-containing protein [Fimbriimonadaceae bacterium]